MLRAAATDWAQAARTALVVGAGRGAVLDSLWACERVTLVEPNPEVLGELYARTATRTGVTVVPAAVSSARRATLNVFNLPELSSLRGAAGILELFPGLRVVARPEVETVPLAEVVSHHRCDETGPNLLVIDAPGEEVDLLCDAMESNAIHRFQWIVVHCGRGALFERGHDVQYVCALMEQVGFGVDDAQADPWGRLRLAFRPQGATLSQPAHQAGFGERLQVPGPAWHARREPQRAHAPTPKISVIVPLFRTEKYVEKCLRSIMRQTFTDFELICVDDCSPDASAAIVERLALEDPRIVLIRHRQNLGLGGARNTGIRAARAEYIASVDSDDHVEENMLGALWEGTRNGHFDVVVCGFVRVDDDNQVISPHAQEVKVLDPIPDELSRFAISAPAFWNKLWRKSLYTNNNIYFPLHIFHQDSATTPRIYSKARNINFIGGQYYRYLVRGDSTTNTTSDKHLLDRFREVDTVKEFFAEEGLYGEVAGDIRKRIYSGYRFHGHNAFRNLNGGEEATDRYLRYLLLMREAYVTFDDTVRAMSIEQKLAALQSESPLPAHP